MEHKQTWWNRPAPPGDPWSAANQHLLHLGIEVQVKQIEAPTRSDGTPMVGILILQPRWHWQCWLLCRGTVEETGDIHDHRSPVFSLSMGVHQDRVLSVIKAYGPVDKKNGEESLVFLYSDLSSTIAVINPCNFLLVCADLNTKVTNDIAKHYAIVGPLGESITEGISFNGHFLLDIAQIDYVLFRRIYHRRVIRRLLSVPQPAIRHPLRSLPHCCHS